MKKVTVASMSNCIKHIEASYYAVCPIWLDMEIAEEQYWTYQQELIEAIQGTEEYKAAFKDRDFD